MISKIHLDPGDAVLNDTALLGNIPQEHITTRPYQEKVQFKVFPEQDIEKIGTSFRLRYRDQKNGNFLEFGYFKVVRWDKESPNRIILINIERQLVLVTSEDKLIPDNEGILDESGNPIDNAYIHLYPIQNGQFLGMACEDEYFDSEKPISGNVIRIDEAGEAEEKIAVIYEKMSDGTGRFVLLDETRAIYHIKDTYPMKESLVRLYQTIKEDFNL